MILLRERPTHADRLTRWLGAAVAENLSQSMKEWYGPPIAVGGVPGNVRVLAGGDFQGEIKAGGYLSAVEWAAGWLNRKTYIDALVLRSRFPRMAGFASLSDLIAERTAGKGREFAFQKATQTGVIGGTTSLWGVGNLPPAGANAANAPGGTIPDDSTTGAFPFVNPAGGDTQHFVAAWATAAVQDTLLLYDRLFAVNKTMNSTATEAVTGVPTRYQSTTPGADDYVGGNFLAVEVGGTALAATAHNWTVCTYLDQANAASTMPSLVGNSGAVARRFDHPLQQWFAPLEAGDVGIKALTQMQCSAAVATGVINFIIGHPIAFLPIPIVNLICVTDGINTAFNLARIFDDAALALLEVNKVVNGGGAPTGQFLSVAG